MDKADNQNARDPDSQVADRVIKEDEKTMGSRSYSEMESASTIDGTECKDASEITPANIVHKNQTADQVASQICAGHPLIIRPSWMSLSPHIIGSLLITFVVFYASAIIFTAGEYVPVNAIFIPLCLLMVIVHKRYNSKFMVTPEGIFVIRGLLGLETKRVRLPYSKIREFEIRKSIIHRVMFLPDADIYISTMLFDEPEVEMAGFSNPLFYIAVFREMIRKVISDPDVPGNPAESALAR